MKVRMRPTICNMTPDSRRMFSNSFICCLLGLRLYPVVPRNIKIAVQDDVWPDGTRIYKGEWFSWSSYVMGRSTAIWGSDAREYKPERWVNTEKPSQGKFNSFHAGPRVWYDESYRVLLVISFFIFISNSLVFITYLVKTNCLALDNSSLPLRL